MAQSDSRSTDDVATFLRQARSSANRTETGLKQLSIQRDEAAARMASLAEHIGNGASGVLDELLARDEELEAVTDELREQVDAMTQACALLERERTKYVDLFTQAPEAYVVTDLMGVALEANVAAEALFGVEAGFLSGRPLIAFVAPQDTRVFRELLRELCESEVGIPARSVTLRMRPRWQPVLVAAARVGLVRAQSGKPIALRWMLRAIDTDEAEAGKRMIDAELARMVAHDLRNPLTTIAGWVRALRDGQVRDDEEREKALAWIERSAALQQGMLDDLAELGEVYDAQTEPPDDVDLINRVRTIIALVDADRIGVENGTGHGAVLVRAHPRGLDRALELVVRRALAGTPQNGEAVRVRTSARDSLTVLDVEPPSGARVPAAWGVRMAIVARIAENCGGRLVLGDDVPSARLFLRSAAH